MKVEIDLNDILGDECGGAETLQESVRRQVIENLTEILKKGIGRRIDAEVSSIINREIAEAVKSQMPSLLEDLMSAEYVPVDRWGDSERGKTTFRKELVKAIHEQMKYKKANFDSEKNAFTRAVDDIVAENVKEFRKEFGTLVNATFTEAALAHASKTLKEKLGIQK